MDRGFLFGDAVYEVIPVYNGKVFHLSDHLGRLEKSIDAIRMQIALTRLGWQEIIKQLLAKNSPIGNALIYLQVSRGTEMERNHALPVDITPTVFIRLSHFTPPTIADLIKGVHAITLDDPRWANCNIKSVNLLANILANQTASDQDANEAILIRDNLVMEGAASNVFIVEKDHKK